MFTLKSLFGSGGEHSSETTVYYVRAEWEHPEEGVRVEEGWVTDGGLGSVNLWLTWYGDKEKTQIPSSRVVQLEWFDTVRTNDGKVPY